MMSDCLKFCEITIEVLLVVTYESNTVSNRALRDAGITVHEINGSELGKGRGGPRCMSNPLKRGALDSAAASTRTHKM